MKRLAALTVLSALLSFSAFSADSGAQGENVGKGHPCHTIKEACEAAGFHKGGYKEGKGLWKNCINEILAGRSVASVNVKPEDVQACQAKRDAKHKRR